MSISSPCSSSRRPSRSARSRGEGARKIINVASILAQVGGIRVPSYTAAKHGVAGLTKLLANEWAAQGHQRERDRAGLCAHRRDAGAAGRSRAQPRSCCRAFRPAAGASRRTWAARRCSSPRARRIIATAPSWWWMAGGWRGNCHPGSAIRPALCRGFAGTALDRELNTNSPASAPAPPRLRAWRRSRRAPRPSSASCRCRA